MIDYIRENDQCNYADVNDYFKDLSQCDDSLKVKYLMELFLYILQEEQKEFMGKVFNVELTDKEILTILQWHKVTDEYFADRGVYLGEVDIEILNKLEGIIK